VTVETDPDVLELLVGESVDNAIRHADGEPTVEVRARRVGDGVEITIADDGPGIPEHELAPIRSGSESQLQHGSGIGLWLLRWGARALGGTVAFEDRDSGGTVVRIGVPGPVVDPDD
jgi:signal transduction histidine kinase